MCPLSLLYVIPTLLSELYKISITLYFLNLKILFYFDISVAEIYAFTPNFGAGILYRDSE
jgi:hypothetical protein